MPREFDRTRLALELRRHRDLRCPEDDTPRAIDNCGNGITVFTLAPDLQFNGQIATVRFDCLPSRLQTLGHLHINIITDPEHPTAGAERVGDSVGTAKVTIDEQFDGITTLVSPSADEEHLFDVLAVSGLGCHPFGSFVHKGDAHMWLTDSLPDDMPTARVMIYGYKSGLQHKTSCVQLDDLASSLQIALSQLLRSERSKPLLLIGHSLGGLLVKEALIRIGDLDSGPGLLGMIAGLLFFGAPNDGMDIESLVPIVGDQPNRFLLESLSAMNAQILGLQRREFARVLNHINCHFFCFYETEFSPTAAQVGILSTAENDYTKIVAGSNNRVLQDERQTSMPC